MEQCQHDSYLEGVKEQQGEGCHLWGSLEVNKVRGWECWGGVLVPVPVQGGGAGAGVREASRGAG